MKLKLELEVDGKIEAYQIVNHLSFDGHIVLEAQFDDEKYEFGEEKNEKPRRFLSDKFNKSKVTKL
jgi:hypothetical protein